MLTLSSPLDSHINSKGQCRNKLLLIVMVTTVTMTDGSSSGSTDSSHSGMTPPGDQAEGVPLPFLDTEKIMEKLSAIERKSVCCSILCIKKSGVAS